MTVIRDDLLVEMGICGSILVIKMLAMVPCTAYYRFTKKAFANPEDTQLRAGSMVTVDEDVERIRRAHQNDLENIPVWFFITLMWLTTEPSHFIASVLIRLFVLTRIAHTLIYAFWGTQPHRAISFFIGFGIILFEAIYTVYYYIYVLLH